MYYGQLYKTSIVDGPGVRVALYVSGCRNHCPGCHNKVSWDFNFGKKYTKDTEDRIIQLMDKSYISGLSILGGEPMEEENQVVLLPLVKQVKQIYPDKNIWLYTGYEFNDLLTKKHCSVTDELLSYVDTLVVGPFILSERDITDSNRWRGSRNQRILDSKKSILVKQPVYVPNLPNNN